ncbi:hypothetical protein MPDQ_000406 [Monascus purpureus]|uniref:Uncharacterized protein n=1 Tax=Monascus purpureus TaxID=5098 RepID=A0A507QS38_MONPU|nr:hypothetical protein MPDQ_000406 [Monascus purpureus]
MDPKYRQRNLPGDKRLQLIREEDAAPHEPQYDHHRKIQDELEKQIYEKLGEPTSSRPTQASQQPQQRQKQSPTIADLCQECNLLFCDVLHHVSIVADALKSHPSFNHRGYNHEDLIDAYSTFRYVCSRLKAHGRGKNALEVRIPRDDSEFFVMNLRKALTTVIKALEEVKPVITRHIEKKVVAEKTTSDDPQYTMSLLDQLKNDPDLAWFETFLTQGAMRCVLRGLEFFGEISQDLAPRLKCGS